MAIRVALSLSVAFLVACSPSHSLFVDLRTDLAPGDEFDRIDVKIDSDGFSISPSGSADLLAGMRIYESEIAQGNHTVTVGLLLGGREVVARAVRVSVDGARGLTVVLTRSCVDVTCPMDLTCISGACASPACSPETPEACPSAECEAADECSVGMCGTADCILGACFQFDDGRCGADTYCDPAEGCVPRVAEPDASGGDASGVDGGSMDGSLRDSGVTDGVSVDSSSDVSFMDTGVSDTGMDSGIDSGRAGACRNATDGPVITELTVASGINLGLMCGQTHSYEPVAVQNCVQGELGVSDPCAQCFRDIVLCARASCADPCASPFSVACSTCRMAACDPGFEACSGFTP